MNVRRCVRCATLKILAATCIAAAASLTSAADEPAEKPVEFAIALHGGAGIEPARLSPEDLRAREKSLAAALDVGRKILADGGTALDAVEQTVRVLEDDPLFNAGRGAVFHADGGHELDATIMDGRTRQGGGVAAITTVKNPISLARLVMTDTRHVLLVGAGAEKFADQYPGRIERVPNSYFSTESRRRQLLRAQSRERQEQEQKPPRDDGAPGSQTMGTVGCVALDRHGNLAAATSTGGLTNKRWGRVGDSAILGAGTYADNATCAVSGTGTGEFFIRNCAGFHVAALMAYKGLSLDEAIRHVVDDVFEPGTGGLIGVDNKGRIAMHFNTPGMSRASTDSSGKVEIQFTK